MAVYSIFNADNQLDVCGEETSDVYAQYAIPDHYALEQCYGTLSELCLIYAACSSFVVATFIIAHLGTYEAIDKSFAHQLS